MAHLRLSQRGLRAFLIPAISAACFFAFLPLYPLAQDIGRRHASAQKAGCMNISSPSLTAHPTAYKKVAIPFGDAACNVSRLQDEQPAAHLDLVKRANVWTLSYDTAVCKGKRLREQIDTSNGNGRIWQYSDLDRNGWTVTRPGENGREAAKYPDALEKAMTAYGISTSLDQNPQIYANLDHPFVNDAGETVEQDCGYYENAYNIAKGSIVAIQNASPAYCAGLGVDPPLTSAQLAEKIPPLSRWSDVVWTIWAHAAGAQASTLRYIFRDNVVNDNSKHIMDAVMKLPLTPTVGNLYLPFPGETFDLTSDEGCALLATPHWVGIAHLLIDHTNILRGRHLKITIYTAVDETRADRKNQYFMIFDMQ